MRYLTAGIIFVVLIVAMTGSFLFCMDITSSVTTLIDEEIDLVLSTESVSLERIEQVQEMWSSRIIFLSSIAPHDKINDVTITISECVAWAKTDDAAEYLAALTNLKSYVNVIRQLDLPTIAMVF